MKSKKVHDVVKRERFVTLWTGDNKEQWIGHRGAIYDITGTPAIKSENEFIALNDLPDKVADNLHFQMRPLDELGFMYRDNIEDERKLKPLPTTFAAFGVVLHAFADTDTGRIYFVQEYTLTPFDKETEAYLRKNAYGDIFVAIKEGFFIRALIRPYPFFKTGTTEQTLADLNAIVREIEREEIESEGGGPEQETLE